MAVRILYGIKVIICGLACAWSSLSFAVKLIQMQVILYDTTVSTNFGNANHLLASFSARALSI